MRKFLLVILLLPLPVIATDTFECKFTSYSTKQGNKKEDLQLTYVVDDAADKAYMVGNNGSSEVIKIDKGNGISFIEITGLGNVMTTTIDKEHTAVHSRNTVGFTGELLPSQYYGHCSGK